MTILITQKGKDAQKIEKSYFKKEDRLQEYIYNYPEAIPIYELQEDKRLFVAKREFPTHSGPIDALAIDQIGDIYIVETKLYKNPDKRTVIAQALDYGASLWKYTSDFSSFIEVLNQESLTKFNLSIKEKVQDFYGIEEEDSDNLLESLRINLNEGNIKFVILMDKIDDRLKDMIIYINQNSKFDIYAVQLDLYKFEDYEILIPKLFGSEVKKIITQRKQAEPKKELMSVVNEFNRLYRGDYKISGKGSSFRKVDIPEWPSSIHYEFLQTVKNGLSIELHIENDKYKSLANIFKKLADSLPSIGDNQLEFDPKWSSNRGRLRIVFGEESDFSKIAQSMIQFIEKTKQPITEEIAQIDN